MSALDWTQLGRSGERDGQRPDGFDGRRGLCGGQDHAQSGVVITRQGIPRIQWLGLNLDGGGQHKGARVREEMSVKHGRDVDG